MRKTHTVRCGTCLERLPEHNTVQLFMCNYNNFTLNKSIKNLNTRECVSCALRKQNTHRNSARIRITTILVSTKSSFIYTYVFNCVLWCNLCVMLASLSVCFAKIFIVYATTYRNVLVRKSGAMIAKSNLHTYVHNNLRNDTKPTIHCCCELRHDFVARIINWSVM